MSSHNDQRLFSRRQMMKGGIAIGMLSAPALLPGLALSQDRALLSITYASGKTISFDQESYAALPWQDVRTHTFWTDGPQDFRGPLLRDVLMSGAEEGEMRGKTLLMRALNDFAVEVPADDAWDHDPILAREMNGAVMSVRDKGPLWMVYPRDDQPELQTPAIDERWIWQLSTIQVI